MYRRQKDRLGEPHINSPGTREFCDNLRSINTTESAGCAGSFDVAYAEDVV